MTDPKEVNILNDFASLFLSEEASGTENKKMSRCWKEERRVLTHNVVRFGPRTLVGARRVRDEFLGTAHIRRVPSYIRGFLDPLSSAHHDPRRGQKPGKLLTHPQREWACSKPPRRKETELLFSRTTWSGSARGQLWGPRGQRMFLTRRSQLESCTRKGDFQHVNYNKRKKWTFLCMHVMKMAKKYS
nr:uncharacterized protein LOC105869445 isoform X2 [Microcebus murinus]